MGKPVPIEFAHSAHQYLRDIVEWYASHVARIEQLATFPDSGKVVPEFETPWLRELVRPPFRIVYRRHENLVTVVRVWRSERLVDPDLGGNA
ncbi:MAG: type II toxin-antitoxin system RelE/ParE family toxin [Coriobacteriia bacterium]|nr:type II toxin-antitoxin system RelE/ParE family toxin [Coriobacteriia bacterium]